MSIRINQGLFVSPGALQGVPRRGPSRVGPLKNQYMCYGQIMRNWATMTEGMLSNVALCWFIPKNTGATWTQWVQGIDKGG